LLETSVGIGGSKSNCGFARAPTPSGEKCKKRKKRNQYVGSIGNSDERTELSASLSQQSRVSSEKSLLLGVVGEHAGALAQPPFIDHLDVETPVAPDLETGQLAFFEQAINRRAMYSQIFRELIDGQDFR
jgi:hypothetical protein